MQIFQKIQWSSDKNLWPEVKILRDEGKQAYLQYDKVTSRPFKQKFVIFLIDKNISRNRSNKTISNSENKSFN